MYIVCCTHIYVNYDSKLMFGESEFYSFSNIIRAFTATVGLLQLYVATLKFRKSFLEINSIVHFNICTSIFY